MSDVMKEFIKIIIYGTNIKRVMQKSKKIGITNNKQQKFFMLLNLGLTLATSIFSDSTHMVSVH